MHDQIPILVRLSRADQDSHRIRERVLAIPREIERHEAELRRLQQQVEEQQMRLEESGRERRALERDSDTAKSRRREVELQQFRVKNNTEYTALSKEIEEMRRRASDFEDRALAILTEEEQIQAELTRVSELAGQEARRVAEVVERLRAEVEQAKRDLQRAENERAQVVELLDVKIRVRYERILKNKGDYAVVTLHGGACGGCFYQLPPQRSAEVRRGDSLILCEGCGRMIVAIE